MPISPLRDGIRTPFGEILDDESAGVADRLGGAMVYGEDAVYLNRRERTDFPWTPSQPVKVWRVSVWKEGALDAGHSWDTSRVNTDTREPGSEPEPPKEEAPDPVEKPAGEEKKDGE